MKVLFLYRNQNMGYSVGKVFRPIEKAMQRNCTVTHYYIPNKGYHPLTLLKNIQAVVAFLKAHSFDLIHVTGTEHYLIPFLKKYGKVVVTVHDLNYMQNTFLWNPKTLMRYWIFVRPLKGADMITCISEKTLAEVIHWTGREKDILSIWNPVGDEFNPVPRENPQLDHPVILHVGTKRNKNLALSIEALKGLPCHLRIIGKLTAEQHQLLDEAHQEYSNAYDLTDEQIREEYIHCDIVNFPSIYEGFGMPIIEGQAIGRPVVTSNLAPMNEVGRNSVVYVDPYEVTSLRNGYERALASYDNWVKKGNNNVKDFRLETITQQYYRVYQRMVTGRT